MDNKTWECPKGSKTLQTKGDVANQNPEAKVECEICRKIFKNPHTLRAHVSNLHTNRERPRCATCHSVFYNSFNLREHIKAVHSTVERPRFPCTFPRCEKTYLCKYDVKRHVKIEHAENPVRFPCTLCGKEFKSRGNLELHIHTHTTEKPYKCATCGRSFSHKSAMKSHEMTHLEKSCRRIFKCHLCPVSALRKSSLQSHVRFVHEKQSNYSCSYCEKKFWCVTDVNRHVEARHPANKEESHSCDKCDYKSHSKYNLAVHKRRRHITNLLECYFCEKKFRNFVILVRHCGQIHTMEK